MKKTIYFYLYSKWRRLKNLWKIWMCERERERDTTRKKVIAGGSFPGGAKPPAMGTLLPAVFSKPPAISFEISFFFLKKIFLNILLMPADYMTNPGGFFFKPPALVVGGKLNWKIFKICPGGSNPGGVRR